MVEIDICSNISFDELSECLFSWFIDECACLNVLDGLCLPISFSSNTDLLIRLNQIPLTIQINRTDNYADFNETKPVCFYSLLFTS